MMIKHLSSGHSEQQMYETNIYLVWQWLIHYSQMLCCLHSNACGKFNMQDGSCFNSTTVFMWLVVTILTLFCYYFPSHNGWIKPGGFRILC